MDQRRELLTVDCPHCLSPAGEHCDTEWFTYFHAARIKLYIDTAFKEAKAAAWREGLAEGIAIGKSAERESIVALIHELKEQYRDHYGYYELGIAIRLIKLRGLKNDKETT